MTSDRQPDSYAEILRNAASTWPERTALTFEDQSWTFAALDAWVDEVAAGLFAVGVTSRVLLVSENRPEYLVTQFALARIGAAFVTPNPAWTRAELRDALAPIGAEVTIGESSYSNLSRLFIDIDALPRSTAKVSIPPSFGIDHEAYLPFSSGTTGIPKGVRHTTASLCGAAVQLSQHLGLTPEDHVQLALPLCHIFGATMSAAAFSAGAHTTLFRRFDLQRSLTHAQAAGVTIMPIAGTIAYSLANLAELGRLPSMRYFLWGGGPVPAPLAQRITARTGVGFLCSYGMTEAMVVAFNPVAEPDQWHLDSPGFVASGMAIRTTSAGEIEVRGVSVAVGYAGSNEGWTPDGWFRTGDLGRVGDDGRLAIVGRAKEMLKVSGFAVSPTEIEAALLELDGVRECGVYGEPDERQGERPVAVVIGDATEEALVAWAEVRLARYKRPHRYVFAESLPRTAGGKMLRRELKGLYA